MGMDHLKAVGNLPQANMKRQSAIDNQNAERIKMNTNNPAGGSENKSDVKSGRNVDTVELLAHKTEHTERTNKSLEEVQKTIVSDFHAEQEAFDAKLQRIQQEVRAGNYQIDPQSIAAKIAGKDQ